MNTIQCPHCGKSFEISDALSHQLEQGIVEREEKKHREELEKVKQQALEDSTKKIKDQFALQLKHAEEDKVHQEERNKELLEQITELTKQMREMKREKDEVKTKNCLPRRRGGDEQSPAGIENLRSCIHRDHLHG